MPQYQIEVSHQETREDCLRALKEIMTHSTHILSHTWFGCMAGVHSGWVSLEAQSQSEARMVLPSSWRSRASVVEVQKFTPAQIQAMLPPK